MRKYGVLSRVARVAGNPYRSCFQSFTPVERKADEGWPGTFSGESSEPTPFYRMTVLVTL